MATVKLLIRGKAVPSNLYVRFVNGRNVNITARSNIFIDPAHWDNVKGNYRNLSEIKNRQTLIPKFEKLKVSVLEAYNDAYMHGEVIDRQWLEKIIQVYFNRPTQERKGKIESHFVYYSEFANWWLKEQAPTWRTEKKKFLSRRAVQQYETFINVFEDFQGNKKIKIKDVDNEMINDFVDHICDKMQYAPTTSKRLVGRIKFFLTRAESFNITVNPNYKDPVYVNSDEEETLVPYLNEDEILRIFNLDLSQDEVMDNIRDSFIIGLWTGLRISDFNNRLDMANIEEDYINIKTKKTGSWVTVPLHPQFKDTLKKRLGNLPVKYSDKHFNEKIKIICMLCDIDQEIKGKLMDKKTNRKVIGNYKKWQLITSHTCRRSFATNLHTFVPDHILADLGGWADIKMMLHYVKRTKKESAQILKQKWDEKYNL